MNYPAAIDALERHYPELAEARVPAGMTRYWLKTLKAQIADDQASRLPTADNLPRQIRLADDLRIIAGLLSMHDMEKMLALMLELPRFPHEAAVVAAPDLASALEYLARSITRENPHYSMKVAACHGDLEIELEIHEALGELAAFIELGLHVHAVRFIRSFVFATADRPEAMGKIGVRLKHAGPRDADIARRLLGCAVETGCNGSKLLIPGEFCSITNVEHDPAAWSRMLDDLGQVQSRGNVPVSSGHQALLERISEILMTEERVPPLPRLARELGLSERTFSRRLSADGLSMHTLVATARKQNVKRLLGERGASVATVSRKLGYSDPSSFVRAFREWYGVSPGKWRTEA